MVYSTEQVDEIETTFVTVGTDLLDVYANTVQFGETMTDARAREHLLQGVSRRLHVLRGCLVNVFDLFPVAAAKPIGSERLYDVQINLHAFVINLCGIFDNYAWSFIYERSLQNEFPRPPDVGLFKSKVQRLLPQPIREFLQSEDIRNWQQDYLKNYRDALVHRIPIYVPPSVLKPADAARYRELEAEINIAMRARDWHRRDELWAEQSQLGSPCFSFLHSFAENCPARDVLLHRQMLSDSITVIAFGKLYLAHCHTQAP